MMFSGVVEMEKEKEDINVEGWVRIQQV